MLFGNDEYEVALASDCQRLARQGSGNVSYGPLARLMIVRRTVDTLSAARLSDAEVLVAMIIVDTTDRAMAYPQMHLRGGLNCVYMTDQGASRHILISHSSGTCDPGQASPGSPSLPVTTVDHPPADVPVTTRWHEGVAGRAGGPSRVQPYFGIACPTESTPHGAWCEPGPPDITDRELPLSSNSAHPKGRRVMGWYDRQILADVPTTGGPVRSGIDGSIVPHPDLSTYTGSMYQTDWRTVATVEMASSSPKYENGYGLKTGVNQLQLRLIGGSWAARMIDQNSDIFTNLKVIQAHTNMTFIAAARWGWSDQDEVMWIPCLQGCCEVSSGFF
jgi:hypothetical protein